MKDDDQQPQSRVVAFPGKHRRSRRILLMPVWKLACFYVSGTWIALGLALLTFERLVSYFAGDEPPREVQAYVGFCEGVLIVIAVWMTLRAKQHVKAILAKVGLDE